MSENYLENNLDSEFQSILKTPPAYMGAWNSAKIIKKIGRDIIYPLIPTPPDPEVAITTRLIPGPSGAPDVPIRIYEPNIKKSPLPGLLLFHYGGYTICDPRYEDTRCMQYVKALPCVVVSPDYRKAPENPAPAAYEDCYAALLWFAANAWELGADPERIAVTGLSCGGGLAAAMCLMLRDRNGPKIAYQMLDAPTIDDRLTTRSSREFTDPRALNYDTCRKIWNLYLGKGHEQRDDISPYAAPSRALDYSGLPPCYCFVGELDPHRDEVIAFVGRLASAGVSTGFTLYPGAIHAFELEKPGAAISVHAMATAIWHLKRALGCV